MEDFDEEFSCYGAAISTLTQLSGLLPTLHKLRVLHCPKLTSMQGIQHLSNLLQLNLSSNSIQRIQGLHDMSLLRTLNLSCNNIRVINGISGLYNLETLNLSFNKISSLYNLRQVYGEQYKQFKSLDIRGNNIAQISELKFLSGCLYLLDVAFQGQTGTNPVCKVNQYQYTLLQALPDIQFLDQQAVNNKAQLSKSPRRTPKSPPRKIQNPTQKSIPNFVQPKSRTTQTQKKIIQPLNSQEEKPEIQKQEEIDLFQQYRNQIIRLQSDNQRLFAICREAHSKIENNDSYQSQRIQMLQNQLAQSRVLLKELKGSNKTLKQQLQIREAQFSSIEQQVVRNQNSREQKEKMMEEMHERMTMMMKDLAEAQRTAQQAIDQAARKQEKVRVIQRSNEELKQQLKIAEQSVKELHSQALESSRTALQKYEELHDKYQKLGKVTEEKEQEIQVLKEKNKKLFELNAKFDQNWSQKFREAIQHKDALIVNLKEEISKIQVFQKEKAINQLFQDKEEQRQKFWVLQQQLTATEQSSKILQNQLTTQIQNQLRSISDLQRQLNQSQSKQISAKQLITELTELLKQLQQQFDKQRSEFSILDSQNKQAISLLKFQLENLNSKFTAMKTRLQTADQQLASNEEILYQKNKQITRYKRELQASAQQLAQALDTIKVFKSKLKKSQEKQIQEISDLKERINQLQLTLGTKNVIIQDQSQSNRELKNTVKSLQSDLRHFQSYKQDYRDQYEQKLTEAYQQIEKLKHKLNTSQDYISELQDKQAEYQTKRTEHLNLIAQYQRTLQEKAQLIGLIQTQVKNLQEQHQKKLKNCQKQKDQMIYDLKLLRDQLNKSLIQKQKEFIEKNQFALELEQEVQSLRWEQHSDKQKIKEMEEEMRVLLQEMENQKKQASSTLAELHKIFSQYNHDNLVKFFEKKKCNVCLEQGIIFLFKTIL